MSYFHDVNLPNFISIYAKGGPYFQTSIISTASGREVRSTDRTDALNRYIIENCKLNNDQFTQFNAFFRARKGMVYAFRMRDYADCKVVDQVIAEGNDHLQQFQLFKNYNDDYCKYIRKITKPTQGTITSFVNQKSVSPVVDCSTGIISLSEPLPLGYSLTASFTFDVPVRFNSDNFKYYLNKDGSTSIDNLELIEVAL